MSKDLNTHFCIVGSGPAGSILAQNLAKKGFQTILVEAGSLDSKNIKQPCFDKININKNYQTNLNSSYQVGGASNLWSGKISELDEIDFTKRTFIKDYGWPFKKKKLDPYYNKASKILSLPSKNLLKNISSSSLLLTKNDNNIFLKNTYIPKEPYNFKYLIKSKINHLKKLKLLTESKVLSLSQKTKNGNIYCANVKNKKLQKFKIFAKIFILACGGIEIPRILLNSQSEKLPYSIGNRHGNVGRYFSTHPRGNLGVAIIKKEANFNSSLFKKKIFFKGYVRSGLVLSKKIQLKKNIINHFVEFFPYGKKAQITNIYRNDGTYLKKISLILGLEKNFKYFHTLFHLDQIPNKNNKVFLSKKKDKYGMPLLNVNWKFTKDDQKSLTTFNKYIYNFFKSKNLGQLNVSFLKNKKNFTAIHSHFMGTTRMGSNPLNSVTDHNGKVHGVKNLFISGPSLFSTYGNSNPMLTIVAVAFKQCNYFLRKSK